MPITVTDLELDYRANKYQDSKTFRRKHIVCATCGADLTSKVEMPGAIFVHPFISTLQCKKCCNFYGDGDFSMDEDGDDKYCRICGNGGELYICGNKLCPYGFCHTCIKRFMGSNMSEVEADDWKCLHCNCTPLWEVRAACAFVLENSRNRGKKSKKPTRDEVYKLDDNNCSSSEDLDGNLSSTKPINNSKKNKKIKKLEKSIDSSTDSHQTFEPDFDINQRSASRNNTATLRTGIKGTRKNSVSSVDQHFERIIAETSTPFKYTDKSSRLMAERDRKQYRHHSSQRNPKSLTSYSDSSGSESANDFVKSKKKNNTKVRKHTADQKDPTIRKAESCYSKSSNSVADEKRVNRKFESLMKSNNRTDLSRRLTNGGGKEIHSEKSYYFKKTEETDNKKKKVCIESKSGKQHGDSEDNDKLYEDPTVHHKISTIPTQKPLKIRLSTKARYRKSLSTDVDNHDNFLDQREVPVKLSNVKGDLNEIQASTIRTLAADVIEEMKMFGISVSVAADKLAKKHLPTNFTKFSDASKAIQKCELFIKRCKNKLNESNQKFVESYENWCQDCNVSSTFLNIENVVAIKNQTESSTHNESFASTKRKDYTRRKSEADDAANNIFTNSDTSDNANLILDHEFPQNASKPILETSDDCSNIKTKYDGSPSLSLKRKLQVTTKNSSCLEGLQEIRKVQNSTNSKAAAKSADSNGHSQNIDHGELSEFDSNEIFSDDENRGDTLKMNGSPKHGLLECLSSNNLKNPASKLDESDEHKIEAASAENFTNIGTTSLHLCETMEGVSDVAKKHKESNKINFVSARRKNTEKSSTANRNIEGTKQPNSLLSDSSSDDTTQSQAQVMKNWHNNEKPVTNSSEKMTNKSGNERSVLPDTDNKSNVSDGSTFSNHSEELKEQSDSRESLTYYSASPINDPVPEKSVISDPGGKGKQIRSSDDRQMNGDALEDENKLETSVYITLTNSKQKEDLSDCEEAVIFTQLPLNDANHIYDTGTPKDNRNTFELEAIGDTEILLQNDVQAVNGAVNSSKAGLSSSQQKVTHKSDFDSEQPIDKKILESDSEVSNNSMTLSVKSNSCTLEMNTPDPKKSNNKPHADNNVCTATSNSSLISKKLLSLKVTPITAEDVTISDLNALAKHRLLSSSDRTSTDSDTISSISPVKRDCLYSNSTSSQESDEMLSDSTSNCRSNLPGLEGRKKKFDCEKNHFYQTDKKLQSTCNVVVRRLSKNILEKYKQALWKSKQRQEWNSFKSLIDVDNIKKRKRGTCNQSESSSGASSSKSFPQGRKLNRKLKQAEEKEKTLLDYLDNVGKNCADSLNNESDESKEPSTTNFPEEKAETEFLLQANQLAKDLLIQSSESDNNMETSIVNEEEQEQPTLQTENPRKIGKDGSNVEEALDSESNDKNVSDVGEDTKATNVKENVDSKQSEDSDSDTTREKKKMMAMLAKRNWTLFDSESSSEEKKCLHSKPGKEEEESFPRHVHKKSVSIRNRQGKRRVLASDSDSVNLTDLSDNSNNSNDKKKKLSDTDSEDSSEIFEGLRKKKRKRNAAQKSNNDSQSEKDDKPVKIKRKRIKKMDSDSDSDNDIFNNSQDTPTKFQRKNIRKVLKDKQVADVTKSAGKEEEERLRRIAERQKLYNEMYEMRLANEAKVDKLVLDFDEETKKELVSVHEDLVKRLKPHQAKGIKFMWDACFESLARVKSTKGSGCILAHCMGLGKTFQVVTLAHTLLTHEATGIKTIMVVCPLSTVLNWVNEFKKWLGDINNAEDVAVFEMTKLKQGVERKVQLQNWQRSGGVMILGYEMFRGLSNQKSKKMRKSLHEAILKCLVDPGADLIVCDEGHLLKNEDTALSKAMKQVRTLRRIVLTGTPLQNNLVEYHCMVQFVKPNLLGTKKEFLNRFVNPITNGQFEDSTEYDVKLMKKRAHVLHKMLEGSVQRLDYSVLTPFLPPKQEYVISLRLADVQIDLYKHYLDNFSRSKVGAGTSLFADFQALQRIWTHPIVLRMNAEKMDRMNEKKRMDTSDSEGSIRDFLDDGSEDLTTTSSDSDVLSAHDSSDQQSNTDRRRTRTNPIEEEDKEDVPQADEWWYQFIQPNDLNDMRISSKLIMLFAILKECEQIGDKVLVFSQSLYALSLIEEFLDKIDEETQQGTSSELIDGHRGNWSLGLDYFRLDGQTAPENRNQYCKVFNNPKNSRARLFLISTRAGGLGINLTAANRVIIFDASWNPSHDVQSIFRIYRFGQNKPCYVYRFLAQGTMEEKIYNRQVTKLSLSCRVVDEQQIERHYSNHDLAELYQFEPNTSKEKPTLNLPKDRLLAEIFRKYEDRIETFHEHDSLLENKQEEELDEEERKEAWKEYEDERTGRNTYINNFHNQNLAMQQYNTMLNMNQADIANRATLSGINIENLQALIQKDYPNATPEQQRMMTSRAIMDMYAYMEKATIQQQQMATASSFSYPVVSNIGATNFSDAAMTSAQRQYTTVQQQQLHQLLTQRELQANYAKRFGNLRGPVASAAPTKSTPTIVNLQIDDDVIEVPTVSPTTVIPAPSSTAQTPSLVAPSENSKRQEE